MTSKLANYIASHSDWSSQGTHCFTSFLGMALIDSYLGVVVIENNFHFFACKTRTLIKLEGWKRISYSAE